MVDRSISSLLHKLSDSQRQIALDRDRELRGGDNGGNSREPPMDTQDRYIDARLDAMQRFTEQAERRMEKAEVRAEDKLDRAMEGVRADGRTTRWTVVGTGIAVVSLVAAIMIGLLTAFQQTVDEQGQAMRQIVSEQGAWLRDSVSRIEATVEQRAAPVAPESEPQPQQDDN